MSIEGAAREGEKKARVNVHSRSSPFLVSIEFLPSAHTDPSLPPAAIPKLVRSLGFFLPSSLSLSLYYNNIVALLHTTTTMLSLTMTATDRGREAHPSRSAIFIEPAGGGGGPFFLRHRRAAAFLPPSRGNHGI